MLAVYMIYGCATLALLAALIYARKVMAVTIEGKTEEINRFREISGAIEEGAMSFLVSEYKYVALFCCGFAVLIYFALGYVHTEPDFAGLYAAASFLMGAFTSSIAAFMGMHIATKGNVRTAVRARSGIAPAFTVAFQSGAVMGFGLSGLAVFGLITMALIYHELIPDIHIAMEMVTGFGLGGSTVALFGRVGGGIFTKAADVGADLVGKVEAGIPEDDPRNPAVIADNVGDNVGDIAGMGADLFGSLAEATCAALVIGASAAAIAGSSDALYYPILVSAIGIPVCLVTALMARVTETNQDVEKTLKKQLVISTVLMTVAMWFLTHEVMVDEFILNGQTISRNNVLTSLLAGLWGGLIIGFVTEYYTSHSYRPVREIADASKTGSATNIIYGLSLGYKSSVIPVIVIALVVFLSWYSAGMYGIAMAAIGMISTIAVGLTIDAYGPVSDNAGGIAEMCELEAQVRERTDILDAAGNTTAAIGKGFAIGSAVLTGLALFAAFLTSSGIETLNLLSPVVFAGMLAGTTLPMLFTAQTMRAVGLAAFAMIEEVRHQFRTIPGIMEGHGRPDYKRCVAISTTAALREMVAPGILVVLSPLLFGILFGIEALAGMLAGAIGVGVVMAVSSSNAGGAWDNAKKYIETGVHGGKGSDTHKAAVVGDTVGDPMKDTSGPSLNILMKLMAIISLVFAPFIQAAHSWIESILGM
ncbi:MAG: V-type H(+)-translocating pyrophosphatase [Deltaproteobacteria bacterium]|nr:V-type H(+)-translocating pyrophosphatase [Deltaproteobacteria bacterium]